MSQSIAAKPLLDDFTLWSVIWRSFYVSWIGALIAFFVAISLSYLTARHQFLGRKIWIMVMQSLMALPPVVVGLGLYMLFRPQAVFGGLGWLYSIEIMILAQVILVLPIVFSLSFTEFEKQRQRLLPFFASLPTNQWLEWRVSFWEAKWVCLTAFLAGFGRAIGEVGAVMIVGGNLEDRTEVMTTVIVEETSKGNLSDAIVLGAILLFIAFFVSGLGFVLGKDRGEASL